MNLPRNKPLRKRSKKSRGTRTGKLGITRLAGTDMEALRERVWHRSHGRCEMRERLLAEIRQKIKDNEISFEHGVKAATKVGSRCWRQITEDTMHLAHLRGKRNNGDSEENVLASCPNCHIEGDHGYYGAPCPPKKVEA